MSANEDEDALWGDIKEMTHRAIDEGGTSLLYQLREYFHDAHEEAVLLSRIRDSRRTSATDISGTVECREIQEESLDEYFGDD